MQLDSSLSSTQSLAMGENQMAHNVMDIQFWGHVKMYVASQPVDFSNLATFFPELDWEIHKTIYRLFKLG